MRKQNLRATTIAGIDVGGTKIRWVLMLRDPHENAAFPWRIVSSGETPTPHARDAFLGTVRAIAASLRTRGAAHIGLGVAGRIAHDTIEGSTNLPFLKGIHLPSSLGDRAIACENDARCFAHAEAEAANHTSSRAAREGNTLVVALGTGVGRALIRNGRVDSPVRFEDFEPWEPAYRKMVAGGRGPSATTLAAFLGPRLAALAGAHGARTLILGGGRFRTRGLFTALKKEIAGTTSLRVRRARFRQNEGAIGAALHALERSR